MPVFTEYWGVNQVQVVLSSGDWTSSRKIKRKGVKFAPSAAGDILIVKEVRTDTTEKGSFPATKLTATVGDTVGCLFHDTIPVTVMIDMAASSLSVPSNCVITFDFEP